MSAERRLLESNLAACARRIGKLRYSLDRNRTLLPLTVDTLRRLSDEQEESLDALILRYSQCVSMIQDQIFRGIALVEQEDLSDKSNRDKVLLMEKLGAIKSAEEFGTAAQLRNKFAHHYPEESATRLERLNLALEESDYVLEVFGEIQFYLRTKGFLPG